MKATPLLVGAVAGAACAALLASSASHALRDLAAARAARSAVAAQAALPPGATSPLVAPGLAVPGPDAQAVLAARVRDLAKRGGVLVEEAHGAPAPAGLVAVRLSISGSEKAVIALADTIERDAPFARFAQWRIVPLAEGGVRLTGLVMGATR